jgi:hypothetical protein
VAAVALPFFLMGLVTAAGFHWTGAAEAERLSTSAQEVMPARSMPGSFEQGGGDAWLPRGQHLELYARTGEGAHAGRRQGRPGGRHDAWDAC